MKNIADTGLLVAAADPHDRHHRWAAAALREHSPFHTCEAVVLETAWVLGSPLAVLTLVARGDLVVAPAFHFATEIPPARAVPEVQGPVNGSCRCVPGSHDRADGVLHDLDSRSR